MPFNAIRENKILTKISEFTVCKQAGVQVGLCAHQRLDQPVHPCILIRVFMGPSMGSQVSNVSSNEKI